MYWAKIHRFIYTKGMQTCVLQNRITKRLAGNFKRPKFSATSNQLEEIKYNYFNNRRELSSDDWKTVTEILIKNYKHINKNNVDAVIVGICCESKYLQLVKSYIKHLEVNGEQPNDATLGKLLRVYNGSYHDRGGTTDALTKDEQEEILEICHKLRSKHDILDYSSCENVIYGLVATQKWRDSLELLEMMRISTNDPTTPAYAEIIIKSFSNKDFELGWHLLKEMLEQGKQPKCEIFLSFLDTVVKGNTNDISSGIEKLCMFLETHKILLTQKVVHAVQDIALKHPNLLVATSSTLNSFGKCSSCGIYMRNISVSDEEFNILQKSFLDKVLIGNDVFQKSTPVEVKQFCNYIERTGPFDCVIDGLNVAYSMGSKKPAQALANLLVAVVKYFQNKNQCVLILGRKHMNNWPKKSMQYVKDNAALFLANDISHDDPFLLYATLKSGRSTNFFSRDFMRQHAFLLGPKLKDIFRRWQQEHQYSLVTQTESGKIVVKEPIRYLTCAHKVQDIWHLPYKKDFAPHVSDSFEKPELWLCLKMLK